MRAAALTLSLAVMAAAAQAEPLTLRQAVAEALGESPAVAGSSARAAMAEAGLREARSYWLPRVDASFAVTRGDNPAFVFGSLLEQGRFGAANFDPAFLNDPPLLTNRRLAVNVRYPLFDQFRRMNAVKQARSGRDAALSVAEETRQAARLEVIARYYGMVLAQQKAAVAAEAMKSAEADANAMRARFEEGLLVESDALAAEVQLASFRQQKIEAEGDFAVARAALATLLRRPLSSDLTVAGEIPQRELELPPLEGAVQQALASRGSADAAKRAAADAALQLSTARGSLLPRVDSFASWGASRGNPDRTAGVVVSVDLFDGAKLARIAQARAAADEARAAEAGARDAITMEVVTAWNRTRAAREKIDVAARAVERADAASRIVRDRYSQGLTTITEQLRAQTALLSARLDLLAARYAWITGRAELQRATGGLTDVDSYQ